MAACVVLVGAVWLIYGQSLSFGFVSIDDYGYILENPYVRGGLNAESLAWAFTVGEGDYAYWMPATWISFMVDASLFGVEPFGYHATNVLLHSLNGFLAFLFVRSLTRRTWVSFLVAALFVCHPLRVESVAWVAERKDVLTIFFGLLALLAYVRYARSGSWWAYAGAMAASWLGLMAKPVLVTLPCVFLLLDFWPLERTRAEDTSWSWKATGRLVIEKIPFFAICGLAAMMAVASQQEQGAFDEHADVGLTARLGNAVIVYATYIGQTFWPFNLACYYRHPGNEVDWLRFGVSLILLLAISVSVMWNWKKRPYLLVGWAWFLGVLVPNIGIVQVGGQMMADRFTYLPHLGLFLALGLLVDEFFHRRPKRMWAYRAVALALLAALVVISMRQTSVWRDDWSLWNHAVVAAPDSDFAHHKLGVLLVEREQWDRAAQHFTHAIALEPESSAPRHHMSHILVRRNQLEEAAVQLRKCVELKPNSPVFRHDLGFVYHTQGKLPEARREFEAALSLDATYDLALVQLGEVLVKINPGEAAEPLEFALERNPENADAHYAMGLLHLAQENWAEAAGSFRRTLSLVPNWPEAQQNLARALARQKEH